MMKLAVWIHVPIYRDAVLGALQHVNGIEVAVAEDADDLKRVIAGADALISAGASVYTPEMERLIRDTPSLRWFQSVSAGNDNLDALGIRDGIVVTGSGGHSGPIVAEHAIALLLGIAHALPDWHRAQAAQIWKMPRLGGYRSLYRATAAVIGLGHIGSEIARRLKGLDMTVLGVSRSGSGGGGFIDEAHTTDALHGVLARAEAVVVAAPLTAETRGLIDADALAAMKPGAFLVNIARGGLIDQDALVAALEGGHLGGAALDVTDPEPLPQGHPLWRARNLLITPHLAGSGSPESLKRLAATVLANLASFRAGEPLTTVLPYGRA